MVLLVVVAAISLLLCLGSVQSQELQVTATWSGQPITGPILIYHDEILVDSGPPYSLGDLNRQGALVCMSTGQPRTSWRRSDGDFFDDVNNNGLSRPNDHQQIRNLGSELPSISRLSRNSSSINPSDPRQNGLWTCRVHTPFGASAEYNQSVLDNFIFAGLYQRGVGGAITSNDVSLSSSMFTGNNPTFTLIGDTTRGPPETYTWTIDNNAVISDGGPYSISIAVNTVLTDIPNEVNEVAYMESRYRSTLVVTGTLPGVYQYSVNNKATNNAQVGSITIEGGGAVTGLLASQISIDTVRVTWNAPAPAPPRGYRMRVADFDQTFTGISRDVTISTAGMYTVRLEPLSMHYPPVEVQADVTVQRPFAPVVTISPPTATTVSVSWTPQDFSSPVVEYRVSLTRVTGGSQMLCPSFVDDRPSAPANGTSMSFSDLQEFSAYNVTVTTVYNVFGVTNVPVSMMFTTLSSAPTGAPRAVVPSMASRSIMVTWSTVTCIERNGNITGYRVEFQEQGQAPDVTGLMFNRTGLTPGIMHTFRVAGVNSDGAGPFTTMITIMTNEEPPGAVSALVAQPKFTSIVLTWSAPQEPNGVIISYEVSYSISSGALVTTNSTDVATDFTIPSLTPSTTVSGISVSAYTSAGRGQTTQHADVITDAEPILPVVMNVQVQQLTTSSVRVSWDRISVPEITGYRVYYRQTETRKRQAEELVQTVPSSASSVDITGLAVDVQYLFQVVALAELGGMNFVGNRSAVNTNSTLVLTVPTEPATFSESGGAPVGAVIGGVVLAIAVVVGIILLVLFILFFISRRRATMYRKPNAETVRYTKSTDPLLNLQLQKLIEPAIEEFPEDTNAIEGESVVFKVSVNGHPEPTLTWYHDDKELIPDFSREVLDDGSLNISSVQMKQGGVYKMVAANAGGTVEQEVKLTVQFEGEKTPDVERKAITFAPVPVPEFGEYVVMNHNSNNQGFRDQFQALESGDEYPKTVGLSADYKKLNRFANITNYDHNRILLTPLQGFADCDREFINGCYIDGYSLPKKFIASQGPIPRTIIDFWRLVWQEKPPTIVMVTNLKEGNKKKCEQYWPEGGNVTYGPFKIILIEQQVFADYCIRTMQVMLEGSSQPHKLQQFHFTAWPDHGVPDYATPMLAFHRRIMSTHKPRRGPVLVHCSAGVGRTGTFICIDHVLEQIKKENVVDIAGAINKMRHQRMKMVQTLEQYLFLHDAVLESVTCGDTQITAADLRLKIKKYSKTDPATGTTTFQSQFDVLKQVSPKISEVICKSATENMERNRRTDYLPSDRFRVVLKGEHPDYINAVFAHGYKHQKAYIIAEGPMESTVGNVLKILYNRKVGAVVMLSDFMEDGQESCYQYWPAAAGQMIQLGEYTVDLISEEVLEGFTIRKLSIFERKSQKAHQVIQLHITCWKPDGQCSNLKAVVDSIDEVAKIQRRTGNKPIFVHCSDTVTRSGMFCAMATVIDRCKTEGVVDVFQVVKALRVQKPGAVPTVENYKVLFESVLTFLDSFDTYANFQNV